MDDKNWKCILSSYAEPMAAIFGGSYWGPSIRPLELAIRRDIVEVGFPLMLVKREMPFRYFQANECQMMVTSIKRVALVAVRFLPLSSGSTGRQYLQFRGKPLFQDPNAVVRKSVETWQFRLEGRMPELWSELQRAGVHADSPPPGEP